METVGEEVGTAVAGFAVGIGVLVVPSWSIPEGVCFPVIVAALAVLTAD